MTRPLQMLVYGYGSIGVRHVSNIASLADVRFLVVDPDPTRHDPGPGITFTSVPPDAGQRFDLSLICSPNHLHLAHLLDAAPRSDMVFVEKPLFHETFLGSRELLRALPCRVMVGCNYRFEPGLRLVKANLDQHRIGKPVSALAEYGNYLPSWRAGRDYRRNYGASRAMGGGVLLDRIHEIDMLAWFFGPVLSAAGLCSTSGALDIDTEDSADLLLGFEGGVHALVHLDYLQRKYTSSLKVIGTAGVLRWSLKPGMVELQDAASGRIERLRQIDSPDINEMYLAQSRHLLDCLASGQPPLNPALEALDTLETALACRRNFA